MNDTIHEVIIIGGSSAGLSAALQLAGARRAILTKVPERGWPHLPSTVEG